MEDEKEVSVKFTTALESAYRVPEVPVSVPTNVTRAGLSKIINHILELSEEMHRVFDFLLNGAPLRGSLGAALLASAQSTEAVIALEYTFLAVPPQPVGTQPQRDWVTALAGLVGDVFVSGMASGHLCTHPSLEAAPSSALAHEGGICAIARLCGAGVTTDDRASGACVLSVGKDCEGCVWEVDDDGQPCSKLRLGGHRDTVACAAALGSAACVTGSWDTAIRVWRWRELLDGGLHEPEASCKRARGGASGEGGVSTALVACSEAAAGELRGHSLAVTGLAAQSESSFVSVSLDHSIKRWDVATGTCVASVPTGKALLCASVSPVGGGDVVAAGATDGTLRLWDVRGRGGTDTLGLQAYRTHGGPLSCAAWQPGSEHIVAAGAYDGVVRLWDVRSPVPLTSMPQHEGKVLAVAWCSGTCMLSGGSDAKVELYRAHNPGASTAA